VEVWKDDIQGDVNVMGIKKKAGKKAVGNGGKLYWKPRSRTHYRAWEDGKRRRRI